eukprot:CAMPEP_0115827482 /NCGR_PEP_ID=MMETSP0287-20121206/68_1 /TAXON_ID=412157 /ORGANISM="Chrysochromulina rotalis, Strain UIO044" /LENGTH=52 /DNA_ID=CAMNT_0003280643 /DNA_START=31 /DNA_END=189 /DNA_ORIENTATION=-
MNVLYAMLPSLAESTAAKGIGGKLLQNVGNITQWCVTFAGMGYFVKALAMTK